MELFYKIPKNHFFQLIWCSTSQNEVRAVIYLLVPVIFAVFDSGKGSVSQKKEAMSLSKNSKKLRHYWPSIFSQFNTLITPFFLTYANQNYSKHIRLKRSVSSSSMQRNFANADFFLSKIFFWILIESRI